MYLNFNAPFCPQSFRCNCVFALASIPDAAAFKTAIEKCFSVSLDLVSDCHVHSRSQQPWEIVFITPMSRKMTVDISVVMALPFLDYSSAFKNRQPLLEAPINADLVEKPKSQNRHFYCMSQGVY